MPQKLPIIFDRTPPAGPHFSGLNQAQLFPSEGHTSSPGPSWPARSPSPARLVSLTLAGLFMLLVLAWRRPRCSLWHLLMRCARLSPAVACGLRRCGVLVYLPHSTWDPSSLTRDQTPVPCTRRRIRDHRTTRVVPPTVCFLRHRDQSYPQYFRCPVTPQYRV